MASDPQAPEASQSGNESPLIERFQNYKKLRQRLELDVANGLPGFMDRGFAADFRNEQALNAASILSLRSIKFLPRNAEITRENLVDSLLSAQNELAQNDDWFGIILPGTKKKQQLAETIASSLDVAKEQSALRAAANEQDAYTAEALKGIPDQEDLINDLSQQLQNAGFSQPQSQTIATNAVMDYEVNAVRYGASPPPSQLQMFISREMRGIDKTAREDDYEGISQKAAQQTREKADTRGEAIGLNRHQFAQAQNANLVNRVFKYTRKIDRFQKLDSTLKTVSKVLHPIRTIEKAIGRKIASASIKLTIKLLQKLGLGSLVRWGEEALVSIGTAGLGIPLMIIQEVALAGINKGLVTLKRSRQELKEAVQSGFQNPLAGSVKLLGWGVDNSLAAVGGGIGAIGGATTGAFIGAALGSVIPILGNIAGGIIGGIIGSVAGAGNGAKKGYELRRKIQKKITTFLAFKALGLNPFKIAWALLKASAIWAIGKVAPFIQTVISRAVLGAKSLIGIARYGPKFLVQQLGAGQGLVAQTLRGIGNLFSSIPSGIARGFNALTGWASGTINNSAMSVDYITTEVLTTGPGSGLPLVSVIGTLGIVFILALITYTTLITVFHSTPTEVIPYVEASNTGSRFIGITKEACVGTTCSEDILSLANASSGGPYSIQYTISVEALDGTLSNVQITDTYAAYGENNPLTPPPESWDGGITIPDGSAWEQTITLTIPRSSEWDDAALTNVVSVTAVVVGEVEPVQNSESVLICFGDCPVCPPTLSPLDSPVISGYHFGSAPTNSCLNPPVEHRGIDINSSSSTVYSSFACPAVVELVDDTTFGLGTYMVLRSGPWYAFYAHLVEESYTWQAGDVIAGRQPIGVKDCTGNCDGTHLHYEIRDSTLGGVNPADHCEPAVSVNPCGFGDWGVGGAETCAL